MLCWASDYALRFGDIDHMYVRVLFPGNYSGRGNIGSKGILCLVLTMLPDLSVYVYTYIYIYFFYSKQCILAFFLIKKV